MNFCTLFNSHYLSRGLALYRSLMEQANHFHLYIFAFDKAVDDILRKMDLPNVTVISLNEFETPALLSVKQHRTVAEYCWTCTPSIILYCLNQFKLQDICYLDADLYFFGSPQTLLEEALDASILITEHRYTRQYDNSQLSGKYCVQFMFFRNDQNGIQALTWWKEACIAWCYNRVEDGKFGDQKYLDDWPTRFQGVKVLTHLGGGVAPWNIQQYYLHQNENGEIFLTKKSQNESWPVIFYHFHGLKFINQKIDFGRYKLFSCEVKWIYQPYVKQLLKIEAELKQNAELSSIIHQTNIHGKSVSQSSFKEVLRNIKRISTGTYHTWHI